MATRNSMIGYSGFGVDMSGSGPFVNNLPLRLPLEDCNRPHGRASAPTYLERQTNKAKTPSTDQQVQIDHVLVMGKAQLPTNAMNFLIRNMKHTRRHHFYAKSSDLLLTQPARRVHTHAWSIVPIGCPKCAAIMIRIQ